MKVVLFCGGMGMRLREFSETIPKPMVTIGYRPILWHIMKYYAHFGHKEFILCLGWKADYIKKYFLEYNECVSNDFVLSSGGQNVDMLSSDIHDWKITFVDTGATSNIGERLVAVEKHLGDDDMFLANYTDGLCDLNLTDMIESHRQNKAIASFVAVKPSQSFHTVTARPDGTVDAIEAVHETDIQINAGYFVLQREIFKYIDAGEELVCEPFNRLIAENRLFAHPFDGFFGCMDTFKEKQTLDEMYARGETPWELWKQSVRAGAESPQTEDLGLIDEMQKLSNEIRACDSQPDVEVRQH
ncbi:MAG: sugar phosphate nucleotidyltransferase [Fuerstiella sp.]|nr:glucose-1-phosphate cytidylyltransferase [Fuerstiella sp.]